MPIDFQRQTSHFVPHTGNALFDRLTFTFPTNVLRAEAAINGFNVGFTESDHHLFRIQVDTEVFRILGNTVSVNVRYTLRDSSGVFDDFYDGTVDVLVIADRE